MGCEDIVNIGSRLELFVDTYLIESMNGQATLRLHQPIPREVVLVTDRPWEGNMCGYITVFRDGDRCRMYYQTGHFDSDAKDPQALFTDIPIAYAESPDGVHWERSMLRLYEFNGSWDNNIVWRGEDPDQRGVHGFTPFRDPRPDVNPDARYKAVGAAKTSTDEGLYAMASPDGIHWRLLQQDPVLKGCAFDSQNLAFWDGELQEYRAYVRDFRDGRREIRTCTSHDFVHWTEPEWLEYPDAPAEQLYTNQIQPYYRAPHLLIGFPTRYVERPWSPTIEALPELEHRRLRSSLSPRYGTALTDGLFMTSRDRLTFRRWPEAFIRPGLRDRGNWVYGDNYQCCGILETFSEMDGSPNEISLFSTESYWRGNSTVFRRYTIRIDGFVSLQAPLSGGEIVTKPLRFTGRNLFLNVSTSAAGSVTVEIQTPDGKPIAGYSQAQCHEIIGDEIERLVTWYNGSDMASLASHPIRLRFVLKDADLYAMRFR